MSAGIITSEKATKEFSTLSLPDQRGNRKREVLRHISVRQLPGGSLLHPPDNQVN